MCDTLSLMKLRNLIKTFAIGALISFGGCAKQADGSPVVSKKDLAAGLVMAGLLGLPALGVAVGVWSDMNDIDEISGDDFGLYEKGCRWSL